jgi:hypothetical protein
MTILSTGIGLAMVCVPACRAGYYVPPEFVYADDLRQSVTLPGRININQASFNQLNILPGFDADLALKVLRSRPFRDMHDFYLKMPASSHKQIDILLERLQNSIRF